MKLSIEKSVLLASLGHAQSIVEKKQVMPILGNVLLDATADGLAITTTNLDMQIVLRSPAEVKEPGSVSAPAHGLTDVVKRMPDGDIGLELVDGAQGGKRLRVTAGRSKIHLFTLPSADFPALPAEEKAQAFDLPAAAIRKLIDRTRFAMHTDEAFFNLCGVYLFQADADHIGGATTDKHRLALQKIAIEGGAPKLPGTILPTKFVSQLRRLVDEDGGLVNLLIGPKRITASDAAGLWELTAKLYEDAKFPPYEKGIPDHETAVEVDAELLADAVSRVGGICVGKQRMVVWNIAPNLLTITARDLEMGDAVEELACEYDGPERVFGFNPKYLSDQLQSIDGAVRFFVNEPRQAVRIEITSDPLATFALGTLPVGGAA
jgi:DNA polymerase-3 subunit beta